MKVFNFILDAIENIYFFACRGSKLKIFAKSFIFTFLLAFVLYVMFMSPFLFVESIRLASVVSGCIGTGIGIALVNATYLAINF